MKLFKYACSVSMLALLLTACQPDKETANLSRVTFFPNFTYNGASEMLLACGTPFNDPGVTATENDADIPVTVSASGAYFGGSAVNTNEPDRYDITYSATNKDGYSGQQSRTVFVACTGDLVNSIEGLYTSTVVRNGASGAQYTNMPYVIIRKVGDNQYALSDAIGGYYDIGRIYGPGYAAKGIVVTANNIAANDFSFNGPVGVGAFGGTLEMVEMSVNPANKTITFTSDWTDNGFTFVVTLKQVTL